MSRPPQYISLENRAMGLNPSLREHWREVNRLERETMAKLRSEWRLHDRKRAKCTCAAYPWPHRPGGGLCRHPDPPTECYQRVAKPRRYRERYAGLRRQIARANGLHPIRNRATIETILPRVIALAKHLKRLYPRYKYRNMEITEKGIRGVTTSAGPTM